MISKGCDYHCVISLRIASNFHISVDPVYSGSCTRKSIILGELRGI